MEADIPLRMKDGITRVNIKVCTFYARFTWFTRRVIVHIPLAESMEKAYSLKARQHYGSNSLDLTIPHSICKEHGISDGDVFILEITNENVEGSEKLVLKYKRVFAQKKKIKENQ
nr:hypothetical protein [Candidatus Sigynarchaeum springense]